MSACDWLNILIVSDVVADVKGYTSMHTVDPYRRVRFEFGGKVSWRKVYKDTFPLWASAFVVRLLSEDRLQRVTEWLFYREAKPGDIVYLFSRGFSCAL